MSEKSTTPDSVELTRRYAGAVNRRDVEAAMDSSASEAVALYEGHSMLRIASSADINEARAAEQFAGERE